MKGGSVTISEEVQLELPVESSIEPRGKCIYGKKIFQITAYDNQLSNGTSFQMEPIRLTYPCIRKVIQKKQPRFIKQMKK